MTEKHPLFQPIASLPCWSSAHLETVGSTNRLLGDLYAERGVAMDRHWLTAGEQSEGKGRRDRHWSSPAGNLYASLCLRVDHLPERNLGILPLAFGLAVHEAIAGMVNVAPQLKWPNDVLIDGAKCCGILLELKRVGDASAVIVGIGLNVASHPSDTPYAATDLRAHGYEGDLNIVFNALAHAVDETLGGSGQPGFVAKIRSDWLAHAKGVGEPIIVRLAKSTLNGIFETLNEDGQLVLRLADKTTKTITAGDVFFA